MSKDWKKELKDYIADNRDTNKNLWRIPESKRITTKEVCKVMIEELTIKGDK
tara:strand:+ start:1026 stop:1181 length:156 start_codon:yes stop_codon:yes gene_type:complete